jgi:hypothetical protein
MFFKLLSLPFISLFYLFLPHTHYSIYVHIYIQLESDSSINAYLPVDEYLVENPLTRMMMTLLSRTNAAIIERHTDLKLEVGLKTFPGLLDKCAFDPFGCASINDFIASNFLPYIFLVYV